MSFRRVLSRTAARSTGGHRNRLRRRFLRCELLEPRNLLAADLDGPVAALLDPVDNGGDDLDETPTVVHIDSTTAPDKFQISLSDVASGVDSESVQVERFSLFQNDREMVAGEEYFFSFDETNNTVSLAADGSFALDASYRIVIDNTVASGVRDAAGNLLAANQVDGSTQFSMVYTDTVNDPPVLVAPEMSEVSEDHPLVFSIATGNGVSVSDVDAFLGADRLEISINVDRGHVTLAQQDALEFDVGDGEADPVLRFSGPVAEINAALDGLRFLPDPDFSGTAEIDLWSSDLGNFTGADSTARTDNATVVVNVLAVNDPPGHAIPSGVETWEDTVLTLDAASGQQIVVSDVDIGDGPLTVTLTAEHGRMTLNSAADVVYRTGGPVDQEAVVFSGPLSAVNEALASVSFRPAGDFNDSLGAARMVIISRDLGQAGLGGEQITVDEIPIAVRAVNDLPVNLIPDSVWVDEDGQVELSAAAGTAIAVTDSDNEEGSGDVRVALAAEHGVLTLLESSGIHLEAGDGVEERQLVITGQLAAVNFALDSLLFQPDQDYSGLATLELASTDVGAVGDVGTDYDLVEIAVHAVNDAPEFGFVPVQQTSEDIPLLLTVAPGGAGAIVDVDAGEGVLTVDLSTTGGVLDLVVPGGVEYVLGDGEADNHIVVTGKLHELNTVLAGLVFTPYLNWSGTASLTLEVDDGGHTGEGGAQSDLRVLDLVVHPVNDPPTAVGDAVIVQRETPVAIAVVDNDTDVDGTVDHATVEIVQAPAQGTAVVQADGTLSYLPEVGFAGVDSLQYAVRDDQGLNSAPAVVTIVVNEPPTAVDDVLVTDQNTPALIEILANDNDPDGKLVPGSVVIVSPPAHGSVDVDVSGGVTYTPQQDYFGFDQVAYTVEDDLGAISNTATVTVAVEWVAPFQNSDQPYDVNNDGIVSAIDVLLIINLMNLNDDYPGPVPEPSGTPFIPPAYYDVNGDNHVTPADAIEVTNYLNSRDQNPEGEAGLDDGSGLKLATLGDLSEWAGGSKCDAQSALHGTENRSGPLVPIAVGLTRRPVVAIALTPGAQLARRLDAVDAVHEDPLWWEGLLEGLFRDGRLWVQEDPLRGCVRVATQS